MAECVNDVDCHIIDVVNDIVLQSKEDACWSRSLLLEHVRWWHV